MPTCVRLPPPPGLKDIDEGEGVAAVKEAFDLGINLFDTSPFYGATKSEAVGGRGWTRGFAGWCGEWTHALS